MKFNDRLQYVASLKKVDQIDIVNDLKIDPATVNRWWLGKVTPRAKSMRLLSDFFECNIDWLANEKGEPFTKPDLVTLKLRDQQKSGPQTSSGKGWRIQDKETAEMDSISCITEPPTKMVRTYRELAEMDADTLGEIQTWLNDMEKIRPGFTGWFRLEFQNRFPEFDEWKNKLFKKRANGGDY